jgi:serine O-acetyltransferase
MKLIRSIKRDIDAVFQHDPAAKNVWEIFFAYPGFHARQFHRVAHTLWKWHWPFFPRFVSHIGRFFTGIEIHPGATIGEGFFIDHGMGVVIGETSEIGENVAIYQGVTLGGTSLLKKKRHPTLGDNVVVGTGAKLIGAITVGNDAKIGAGSVVVNSVPPHTTVVGVPGRVVEVRNPDTETVEKLPDPVWEKIEYLERRVAELEARLKKARPKNKPRTKR